jgi:hypothetical protein
MNRATAPRYDLFKLIVTILLIFILILMLLRGCATVIPSTGLAETSVSPNPSEAAISLPSTTETFTSAPESPTATPTQPAPTQTAPAATATKLSPTSAPTATPQPTATTEAQATATTVQEASCNTSVPSRLAVGEKARVLQRLNMRADASITANIIQTNPTGAQVDIIGGPVCTPVGDHAYVWWQIRLASGAEGWSAESPLNEPSYFLEPTQ